MKRRTFNSRRFTPVDRLLQQADIVQVVEHFLGKVLLQQGGKNGARYLCLCPFHSENKPSFAVIPHKYFVPYGFFHCLGCGMHGNAITFVMERTGLPFKEAFDKVSQITKFIVPCGATKHARGRRRGREKRRRLLAVRKKVGQDRREAANRKTRLQNHSLGDRKLFGSSNYDMPF